MGCSSPTGSSIPGIPAHHLNRLLQVADINHPLNVNKKYQHLAKVKDSSSVGQGFKKTFPYECLTTKVELDLKRKQFWQTRVNGSPQCWNAIHIAVVQSDQATGMIILQSMRLGLLNNSIQMCVDSRFNKYQVPVFCINEPISYSHETMAERNLNYQYNDTALDIKIRTVRYPNDDIIIKEKASTEIGLIKSTLKAMKNIGDDEAIRFFYNGREMFDNKTLGNYNYVADSIIQAIIR